MDKKINTGCIFKEEYKKAVNDKETITSKLKGFRPGKKTVTFCDTSFSNSIGCTERVFLEYLKLIKEFCEMEKEVNILLKSKHAEAHTASKLSSNSLERYRKLWKGLLGFDNFIYVNPMQWSIEEVIAVSDVVVSMGMNSPSTIALICGRNGLYFDSTGNRYHPFARHYKNAIVFDDKELLFKKIRDILNGKFSCNNLISEQEIRKYDTFDDDKAQDRLRIHLKELTSNTK